MARHSQPQVRLYCISAREAPLAVVFRRGPSKQILVVLWRTDTDQFYEGQWFKGRIYERRCDLSPNGDHLIYFAANHKLPYFSWTAISRPPFLTALALWPKRDGWGGGGHFSTKNKILLNHRAEEMQLADGFNLPGGVRVKPLGKGAGWGEDSPILDLRLRRDGWQRVQEGKAIEQELAAGVWIEFSPAEVWARPHPLLGKKYELQMRLNGLRQLDGPWYLLEHVVVDRANGLEFTLGKTDWADWCQSGDLLFAKDGKLFRSRYSRAGGLEQLERARLLIDLTDRRFKKVEPPTEAKEWNTKLRLEDFLVE